jgi:fumarate hydratase class II
MPGKVNPVIPEAVAMACADVIGNDVSSIYWQVNLEIFS